MAINGKEKLAKNWKDIAVQVFSEHPDWNAAQIHRQLIVALGEGKAPASVSSIQKVLPRWKKEHQATQESGIDNPWHLGTLENYPLPAEAIPYILILQKRVAEKDQEPITIRQALWVARLYPLLFTKKFPLKEKEIDWLYQRASAYAWYERLCRLSDPQVDTTILDEALSGLRTWDDAVNMLLLVHGIFTPEAFGWLIQQSQSKNQKIRGSAEEMIDIITHPIIKQKEGEK